MSFAELYQSGNIAFIILALMGVEALLLRRYAKRRPGFYNGLVAGACLVLATRAALLQQGWQTIGLFLGFGFLFHVTEIWQWLRPIKHQS